MAESSRTDGPGPAPRARAAIAWSVGLGLVTLAAVQVVHGLSYWNYSEGVYALTTRLFLHGGDLYGTVVAAQLPPIFVAGAGILAVHDGITWLRLVLGALQLGAGLLGAVAVWRMTRSTVGAALTAPLALLTPWAIHEHGALTPEMFLAPLLLGGVLLADRPGKAPVVGVLAGLCAFVKVPFLLPAVVLVLCSTDRWRTARWAAGVLVAQVVAATAVFGSALWRDTVTAQFDTGTRALSQLVGYWAQALWNLIWLIVPAGVATWWRRDTRDPALALRLAALGLATLLTVWTTTKNGTGLNSLVPVEAMLVPLAMTGAVVGVRRARAAGAARPWRWAGPVLAVGLVMVVAQGISLMADPRTGFPFLRPFSAPAWGISLTGEQVDEVVARARACDPALATSYAPFIAYLAHRRPPGGQPDGFITVRSPALAPAARAIAADLPVCPG